MRQELLIGCGSSRVKKMFDPAHPEWSGLVTLDHEARHQPDVVADLDSPLPFQADSFDEVHAYEVLEHLGQQGDARSFFGHFFELWRVLRPGGRLYATVPPWDSLWAWGDPSHRRIINAGSLVYLDREEYEKQVGRTPMSDFRSIWHGDLPCVFMDVSPEAFRFVLAKRAGHT